MSEVHAETTNETTGANGAMSVETRMTKRSEIVESTIEGKVITFVFKNGETVVCDTAKFPATVVEMNALDGARNNLRLSFQKYDEPVKAATALRERYAKMLDGDTTHVRNLKHVPTDLTMALVAITGKSVKFIEDVWYDRYFASPESGCNISNVVVKGKTQKRFYGKERALERLKLQSNVKVELDKIAKEKSSKTGKPNGGKAVDIANLAADLAPV